MDVMIFGVWVPIQAVMAAAVMGFALTSAHVLLFAAYALHRLWRLI